MINILIVDDSETETKVLKHIFESEQDFHVIACAKDGQEAIELNDKFKPDLITMDIQMPVMDGIKAIREIISHNPVPIVVISSKLNDEMKTAFLALEQGALSVLEKPVNITSPDFKQVRERIVNTIRIMSEIKVIKRRFYTKKLPAKIPEKNINFKSSHYKIIAIGTSVGGPRVLKIILSQIPKDFPLPIVVVQHMTTGYISGFVKWLSGNISLKVKVADHQEILQGGTVYFAPDFYHLEIDSVQEKLIAKLVKAPSVSGFCPSASVLLQSVAKSCASHAIGMLLTGMGNDGAQGLLALKKANGHTIIQDPESAIVFGMAGTAQSLGAVDKVVALDKIAEYLINTINKI